MVNRFALGVGLGFCGTLLMNTGQNFQSLGLRNLKEKGLRKLSSGDIEMQGTPTPRSIGSSGSNGGRERSTSSGYAKSISAEDIDVKSTDSKIWIFGFICYMLGSALNFGTLSLAPQSVLICIESVQFVSNLFWGRVLLGLQIERRMYLGTVLVMFGVTMVVIFGPKEGEPRTTPRDIKILWTAWAWHVYLTFVVITVPVTQCLYQTYDRARLEGKPLWKSEIVRPVCYAVVSAICGSLSVMFAKSMLETLEMLFEGQPVGKDWLLYFNFLGFVGFGFPWMYRLNAMLGKFGTLFGIPVIQSCFILFATITGGIFFQEFDSMHDHSQWWKFGFGIICCFIGLYLLAFDDSGQDDSVERDESPVREPLKRKGNYLELETNEEALAGAMSVDDRGSRETAEEEKTTDLADDLTPSSHSPSAKSLSSESPHEERDETVGDQV